MLIKELLINNPGGSLNHLIDPLAMPNALISLLVCHHRLALAAVGQIVIAHYGIVTITFRC
jgi:hypothetical protein